MKDVEHRADLRRAGATDPDRPCWRVGGDRGEHRPDEWAGLPIVYVPERDIPRRDTRGWVRRTNPLTHAPEHD